MLQIIVTDHLLFLLLEYYCFSVIVPVYTPTDEGKRQYAKTDFCYFCERPFRSKISKHYLQMHDNMDLVSDIKFIPLGDPRRKRGLQKLQNMGNFKHNCKVRMARQKRIMHV